MNCDFDDMVMDSMDSEIEEILPLGNLLNVMSVNNSDHEEMQFWKSSDETMVYPRSPELVVTQPLLHHQVGSDDDTCLSSDFATQDLAQSQISLFSSPRCEKNSLSNNFDLMQTKELNLASITSTSPNIQIQNRSKNQLPQSEQRRRRRKKKRCKWTNQRVVGHSQATSSQSAYKVTEHKPFLKKHCVYMEEINIIESKLSSVEKLISTNVRHFIEQADLMMREEVVVRIERMKSNSNEKEYLSLDSSELESEDEEELNRLKDMKKTRLRDVISHQETVLAMLKNELDRIISQKSESKEDVEESQTILPPKSRRKFLRTRGSSERRPSTQSSKEHRRKVSDMIPPPKLDSKSVIYIPVLSNGEIEPTRGRRRDITTPHHTLSSNDISFKKTLKKQRKSCAAICDEAVQSLNSFATSMAADDPSFASSYELPSSSTCIATSTSSNKSQCFNHFTVASLTSRCSPSFTHSALLGSGEVIYTEAQQLHKSLTSNSPQKNSISSFQSHPMAEDLNLVYLDLSELLRLGLIVHGSNVLSFALRNSQHYASVVGNGLILSVDFHIFPSPMTWIKSITSKHISRKAAYRKVFYRGISLYDLSMKHYHQVARESAIHNHADRSTLPTITTNNLNKTPHVLPTSISDQTLVSRKEKPCSFSSGKAIKSTCNTKMRDLKVRLIKDDELFITSSLFDRNPWDKSRLFAFLLYGK